MNATKQAPLTDAHYPPLLPTQEVRVALVLYGGVSLAIYINGVAQELLSLVRATAPGDAGNAPLLADEALVGTERIYRKLGQMLGWEQEPTTKLPKPDHPITTRFVVDVISGSSAGGINGIFLGKALANEQEIQHLKDLWVDEGDIGLLVNDGDAYKRKDIGHLEPKAGRPPSLLDGRRMYWKLLAALRGLDEATPAARVSRLVEQLDVWITMTDLRGLLLPIELSDRIVFEPRHRAVLNFRYDLNEPAPNGFRHDFKEPFNPLLAFAARATSSFPFAFEPTALKDIDEFVALPEFTDYHASTSTSTLFERFFSDYVEARRRSGDTRPAPDFYRHDAFADGGYLDNKPFSWALESIASRHSELPVDRRLLYVEPSPSREYMIEHGTKDPGNPNEPPPWSPPEMKPDVFSNVIAAAHALPRSEPIRDDLDRLIARNRELSRIRSLAGIVDRTADEFSEQRLRKPPLEQWLGLTSGDLIKRFGLCYAAYHRLKIATVLDELATLAAALLGVRPEGDEKAALRLVLEAWFRGVYDEERRGARTQTRFLYDFDAGYRLRRLRFVGIRIEGLLRLDERALELLRRFELPAVSPNDLDAMTQDALRAELSRLKKALGSIRADLAVGLRNIRVRSALPHLEEYVEESGFRTSELLTLLPGAAGFEEGVRRAQVLVERRRLGPLLNVLTESLREAYALLFRNAGLAATTQLADGSQSVFAEPARRAVEFFYEEFESYDLVTFPAGYGAVDEATRVEVIRVSPLDATSLIDESSPSDGRHKLAGDQFNHFGGFFDRAWRRNDILWGRLDAAERLIESLLPSPSKAREDLLLEAQEAIIEEEFKLDDSEPLVQLLASSLIADETGSKDALVRQVRDRGPDALVAAMTASLTAPAIREQLATNYEFTRALDTHRLLQVSGRATRVTGQILDGISERTSPLTPVARWVTRTGRLGWWLAEVTTPRSWKQLLWRYWLGLLLILAALMIIGGGLFGSPEVADAGWVLLFFLGAGRLFVWLADDLLRRRFGRLMLLFTLALALVLVFAGVEVIVHGEEDVNRIVDRVQEVLPTWLGGENDWP